MRWPVVDPPNQSGPTAVTVVSPRPSELLLRRATISAMRSSSALRPLSAVVTSPTSAAVSMRPPFPPPRAAKPLVCRIFTDGVAGAPNVRVRRVGYRLAVRRRLGGTTMGGRGAAVAAISMAAVLALGGCGSDEAAGGDDPSGAETSSGSTTDDPTETPTETETEIPTEAPEPAVEPASGPELEVSGVWVNAPKGWEQTFSSVVVDTALGRVDHQSGGLLLSVAALGGEVLTPQQAERYFWSPGEKPPNYQRQDPVVMGDVRAGY